MKFNFGKNWERFSDEYLTEKELNSAKNSLIKVLGKEGIENKSFLDIGCGSGLFSICAIMMGSDRVVGIDDNEICIETSTSNLKRFLPGDKRAEFITLSILDESKIRNLGKFDIVYAWGSLHHTGRMWDSIKYASERVEDSGLLWIAIYNKHFTSPFWREIKKYYNRTNRLNRKIIIGIYLTILSVARIMPFMKNNFKEARGMNFYNDAVDWIGGYPYEYATPNEIIEFLKILGFQEINISPALGFTGCNEYLFKKIK